MSRWFRHYAGMMRDDKLVRVAIRSKQTIERVCWIWGAILESAAEIDDNGRYDLDAPEIAYFLRADQSDVDAILGALSDAGRVADSCVVKWSNRQFQSDRSAPRVAAHRERKRAQRDDGNSVKGECNGGVTLQERHSDAPETETELETEEKPIAVAIVKKIDPRGTRLPAEWQPAPFGPKTASMVAAWPVGMLERELSKFRDYYLKTPGARGRSLDWDASLRNWLTNADERRQSSHERPNNPLRTAVSNILANG